MNTTVRRLPLLLCAAALTLATQAGTAAESGKPAPAAASAGAPASHHSSPPFMAVVNGKVISSAEFEAAASETARQKFYHGTPPEGAVEQLMRDVSDQLIHRVLLLEEVARRGVKPDTKAVEARLKQYEERYATSPRWQQEREAILPSLRERLEQDSALAILEAEVRRVSPPSEDKVRGYYKANPDKFTEPEKMRVSMILLEVDPSSPTAVWDAAEEEAAKLVKRLSEGADFAELAKAHSADESADKGGDLGYLHRGMLPDGIQEKIDAMKPGELSPPTRVLQGYAVFRYEARQAPKHHDFATVRNRASDLLARDMADQAWTDFLARLRKKAKVEVNVQRYPALAATAAGGR